PSVVSDAMFSAKVIIAKPVAVFPHPARTIDLAGGHEFGMRFVQQLVTEKCLLKFYQVRRRGKPATSRASFDLTRVVIVPDFFLRLAIDRHSRVTHGQVWNLFAWLIEAGVIHPRRLVDVLLDIAVIILA